MRNTRYYPYMMASLGYNPDAVAEDNHDCFTADKLSCKYITDNAFAAKFKQVIDLLYSNNKGVYPDFDGYLNRPDTPQVVKEFVSNVLMTELPSMPSAPDDETAFATILQRNSSLAQFRDQIAEIAEYFKNNPVDQTDQSKPSE